MRIHLVHHDSDRPFAETLAKVLSTQRFETRPSPDGCDAAVLLVSRAALRDGLGDAPAKALSAGIAMLPIVLGEDAVPLRFPVANKHIAHANDASEVMRLLEDHRKNGERKIAEGKREIFGYGVLLALLGRA